MFFLVRIRNLIGELVHEFGRRLCFHIDELDVDPAFSRARPANRCPDVG